MAVKHLVKIHVLVSFGPLARMGFKCDSIAEVEARLAADMVKMGHAELVPVPEPKKKSVPDKPEQRPAPAEEVEVR